MNERTAMPERFTLPGASNYLNIPANTLRWMRSCDTGPRSYKLAGRVQYDRSDLDQWVKEQRAASERGGK